MVKLTPPMGWNSWNTFGNNINEQLIFETADAWNRGARIHVSAGAGGRHDALWLQQPSGSEDI